MKDQRHSSGCIPQQLSWWQAKHRAWLVCFCLSLSACGQRTAITELSESTPTSETRRDVTTSLASVAEVDGQIVVELGVGHEHQVALGDLFRVYGTDPQAPLKGMLQVTDVVGPRHTLARQIGLHDRSQPLKVADEARLVRYLSVTQDVAELEDTIATERAAAEATDTANNHVFSGLRQHYQTKLGELEQQHRQVASRMERQHKLELEAVMADSARERERKQAEHRAEIAGLRSTIAAEAADRLRQERVAQDQERAELKAENVRLSDRVSTQVRELQALTERIAELHREADANATRYQTELGAEQETREVLTMRIAELERRVAGRSGMPTTVLTNDPSRDETILDRLERVTGERDTAQQRVIDLQQDLTHQQRLLATTEEQLATMRSQMVAFEAQSQDRSHLDQRISNLTSEVAQLKEQASALELARLQAERSYFDLAVRVLNLPDSSAPTSDLKFRLRNQLESSASSLSTDGRQP